MFNRRLLIDSGGEQQTYSVLEIHVDTPDGDHVRSARVELTYNGENNLANTDNKGIAVFYGVPTGTEISYTITAAGYNAATGKWIIPTDVEYETEYVVLSPLLPTNETVLTFIVKDKETGAGIANAYVYLRDGNHQMLMQLGITDSSGSLALSGLTLEPGEYYFDASAAGYNVLLLGYQFTVVDSSPITGTITFELQKGFPLPPTE